MRWLRLVQRKRACSPPRLRLLAATYRHSDRAFHIVISVAMARVAQACPLAVASLRDQMGDRVTKARGRIGSMTGFSEGKLGRPLCCKGSYNLV